MPKRNFKNNYLNVLKLRIDITLTKEEKEELRNE